MIFTKEIDEVLLNSKVVVNRNFPKNFKTIDLKLFAHELKVSIDIPSPLILKNIIIYSNGIGYHIFAKKPCTVPQLNLVQVNRSFYVLWKDLLKVCFNIKS